MRNYLNHSKFQRIQNLVESSDFIQLQIHDETMRLLFTHELLKCMNYNSHKSLSLSWNWINDDWFLGRYLLMSLLSYFDVITYSIVAQAEWNNEVKMVFHMWCFEFKSFSQVKNKWMLTCMIWQDWLHFWVVWVMLC